MARAFTETNKERIKSSLRLRGRELFIKYGLKKTSVDELAKAAGIAKGSFYKFFESKEALFLAIHEESEGKLRDDVLGKLENIKDPVTKLHTFFKSSFYILEEDPLLRMIFSREEFENVAGFMSTEQYGEHYQQDISVFETLLAQWQQEGTVRQLEVTAAANMIASMYYIVLQKDTLGEVMYAKVTDMISGCLAEYLAKK